jgi:1-acyl-sn-glycerol-3-phosphate acyltransferase
MPSLSPESLSILWLALLALLPCIYSVYLATRKPYSVWENILFSPIYTVCRILWRTEICSPLPLSAEQGAIVIANHRCSLDPFFVQMLPGRRVHWMVAKEYCEHAIFGAALKLFQVIPTNRGGMDTGATKHAIRYAQKGGLVGMFPEGRINRTPNLLLSIRPGAAKVALKAGVPIVPCYIEGAPRGWFVLSVLFKPAHVKIHCGTPVYPPATSSEESLRQAELEFMQQALLQFKSLAKMPEAGIEVATRNWVKE